jgi:hypothetical protein
VPCSLLPQACRAHRQLLWFGSIGRTWGDSQSRREHFGTSHPRCHLPHLTQMQIRETLRTSIEESARQAREARMWIMKRVRDGAESCSWPRERHAWSFSVPQSLCRACGFAITLESHFYPSWVLLDRTARLGDWRDSASALPTATLGILIEYTPLPSSPVKMRSVATRGDMSSPTWMLIQLHLPCERPGSQRTRCMPS